ncbi:MAG: hypothetical protein JW786_12755, partial [Desulfobacterales bacterium]|nr:hypothetical protein [Desulfobacterales bacterium]
MGVFRIAGMVPHKKYPAYVKPATVVCKFHVSAALQVRHLFKREGGQIKIGLLTKPLIVNCQPDGFRVRV